MKIYIGIDPSINSTGVCIQKINDDNKEEAPIFFIIKPNKLTKKEQKINIENFNYIIYNKEDLSQYKSEKSHLFEYYKTLNIIDIANKLYDIIKDFIDDSTTVVMEGISYGSSLRTKSIFDLAGLNYLIREKLIRNNINLNICPPAEIKKFASGKGNANKDILIEAFLVMFPQFTDIDKIDDIVDAYFMCKYAFTLDQQYNF